MSLRQRDVKALFGVTTMMALGEELWARYFPKLLLSAGGSIGQVGLYGTLKDLGECIFAYSGSAITARQGEKRSLILFTALYLVGAAILLFDVPPVLLIVGALATTAWSSLSLPATFSVLGKNVESKDLPWAFAIQSIIKRIPIVIGPILGGWLIERSGVQGGTRFGVAISMLIAGIGGVFTAKFFTSKKPDLASKSKFLRGFFSEIRDMPSRFSRLNPKLHALLVSDVLARWSDGLVRNLLVVHITNKLGLSATDFGILIATQMGVSIALYIPVGLWSKGKETAPLVQTTFFMFAIFPLALTFVNSFYSALIAFMIAGLREIGEPARKASITSLLPVDSQATGVGFYYFLRGLMVLLAPIAGALIYGYTGLGCFYFASALGALGFVFSWIGPAVGRN